MPRKAIELALRRQKVPVRLMTAVMSLYATMADKGLQTSDFRLQISDFRFQTSDFRLQTSNFRFQISFRFAYLMRFSCMRKFSTFCIFNEAARMRRIGTLCGGLAYLMRWQKRDTMC
mgnify:CR=1 FL=1